jgi:low affinity Fe/Cu permease
MIASGPHETDQITFALHAARQVDGARVGRPATFAVAAGIIVAWALSGPVFGFSDTWQLVINTGTTIVTFLMVFLIQSTQNRDTEAIQVKLDELIRAFGHARNELLDLEELEERDLDRLKQTFLALAQEARRQSADRLNPR